MEVQFNDHTLRVTGNYNGSWLFLAPEYKLWLDDECVDSHGVPTTRPKLEVVVEDENDEQHHIEAELFSIVGYNPRCEIRVEDDVLSSDRVRVENFLNPFLVLVIIVSMAIMYYIGPEVLGDILPFL